MSLAKLFFSKVRFEELQTEIKLSKRMETLKDETIKYLQQVISKRDAEIERLSECNEELEKALSSCEAKYNVYTDAVELYKDQIEMAERKAKTLEMELRVVTDSFEEEVAFYQELVLQASVKVSALKRKLASHATLIQQLNNLNDTEASDSLPKDLMDQFVKLKMGPESETPLKDELFYKELAKRLTCKICVSDVERLRCSQCLKGICRGCHTKVESCPHCRNEKINFKPIIIPRL